MQSVAKLYTPTTRVIFINPCQWDSQHLELDILGNEKMRISPITGLDIALLKKSAKILRQHLPGKIGQQKALDTVSTFFGYKNYFHLARDGQSPGGGATLQDFESHVTPTLTTLGITNPVIESLFKIWAKLSAFNIRTKIIMVDEFSEHMFAQDRRLNSDIIDFLSANKLPRYEWWLPSDRGQVSSIDEPCVVVLNKVIQQIRELEGELGFEVPRSKADHFDVMAERVRSVVLPTSIVSAFVAVTANEIAAKPFRFDIASGVMEVDGSQSAVWAINHAGTDAILEPVFSTRQEAQKALAGILVAGSPSNAAYDQSLSGRAKFSILKAKPFARPAEYTDCEVKAEVVGGKIVDAILGEGALGQATKGRISAHGFDLILYRNMDEIRLPAGTFSRWGSTDLPPGGVDSGFDYAAASLPKSSSDVYGATSNTTLAELRQLLSEFKALAETAESKIQLPLPPLIIAWVHSRLVSPNHIRDTEQYYEFDQGELARHVPQLAERFPSDLIDEWHRSFVADVMGYRPCGNVEGRPVEFISYLFYYALTGKEPERSNDVKVGTILLSLAVQDRSEQVDIDMLNEQRQGLENALNVMETWRIDVDGFQHGLRQLEVDDGMVCHGNEQRTMSDLFRIGRKFSVTHPNFGDQTVNDFNNA